MPTGLQKLSHLVRLLPQHPVEFWDRVSTVVEVRREATSPAALRRDTVCYEEAIRQLELALECRLDPFLHDSALEEIDQHVRCQSEALAPQAPFGMFHNGDSALARFCYVACRALCARSVVETGVAYGVTTSFVLQALAQQQSGQLLSVDLPPLGSAADTFVGFLVPQQLRSRWQLYRGQSRRVLPVVLEKVRTLDLFIHDSLHTHRNMSWEFREAWSCLRPGGLLISDDVDQNSAFEDFAESANPLFSAVVQELGKDAVFGVAMKRPDPA